MLSTRQIVQPQKPIGNNGNNLWPPDLEWKPPATTTNKTFFIETRNVAEPQSVDYFIIFYSMLILFKC